MAAPGGGDAREHQRRRRGRRWRGAADGGGDILPRRAAEAASERVQTLSSWRRRGGVLLCGYDMAWPDPGEAAAGRRRRQRGAREGAQGNCLRRAAVAGPRRVVADRAHPGQRREATQRSSL